ncbi:protein SCO1 [Marchantia polymorpha subsp. ruderalis]|uniref:Thioredoxin domain-containing protein n=2 Tax=Marchantia polymorpha TaxID=3197 RepID=A0A176VJL9_MARPO|nr:hypothetical protein AXG93_872s1270 [Marchantia polymorpha subsp. ruderalis]PTQ43795.1 hypothetical protein MARPO_0023s0103 [Marchantia polymorpha]BBN01932.1 hypothetical protein Mp_2g11350 [Marchantia polymorpha subsp. ruderalis]|eukprot:PTQ43795.1 hypothetical protein MARPO_0023s0103 [Marchantia polymorpha]
MATILRQLRTKGLKTLLNRTKFYGVAPRNFAAESRWLSSASKPSSAPGGAGATTGRKLLTDTAGPPPGGRAVRGGPVSWASLGLLVVTGVGLITYYDREKKRRIEDLKQAPPEAKAGPSVGKAAIGGPFKLLNHEGKVVTDRDFVGNWTLIYFGFTFCPDICPDELTKLAEAVDQIEKKIGVQVVPVFISIDPERDTVEQVREYLKEFHPRLVGLTGSVNDIRQVAREYRVYYMKTEEEGTDYLVDHSIIMYLMDPNMDFVKFFGKNYNADGLTDGVVEEIQKYGKK